MQNPSNRSWQQKLKSLNPLTPTSSLRIPGPKNKCKLVPSYPNSEKNGDNASKVPMLPDIDSVVFLEPKINVSHDKICRDISGSSSMGSSSSGKVPTRQKVSEGQSFGDSDSSTVDIAHHFNTVGLYTHGYCAVWANGVYALRGQLYGLWDAVRDSKQVTCAFCGRSGATIACDGTCKKARFNQTQVKAYHYPCALVAGLKLDHKNFRASE